MNRPLKNLKTISLFIFFLLSFNVYSECLGDCVNGKGTYTSLTGGKYTGDFANGEVIKYKSNPM